MNLPNTLGKLEQEVAEFLATDSPSIRKIVGEVIEPLNRNGEAFIIGGLIRDIALYGKDKRPASDIDFVVRGHSKFVDDLAASLDAVPNRFGGFGVNRQEFRVDFWCWNKTWAKTNGFVELKIKNDICKTTFFDWDAIVYSTKTGKLIAIDRYLDRLRSRKLDINLLNNPSPLGSLVRSLRRLKMWNAKPSSNLQNFIKSEIEKYNWEDIKNVEKKAFSTPYLDIFPDAASALNMLVEAHHYCAKNDIGVMRNRPKGDGFDLELKDQLYFGPNFEIRSITDSNSLIRKKRRRVVVKQMNFFP